MYQSILSINEIDLTKYTALVDAITLTDYIYGAVGSLQGRTNWRLKGSPANEWATNSGAMRYRHIA
jgi:hypothetical protein